MEGSTSKVEGQVHDVVIVGGGICGLATALALHRKGISSVVLEKSDNLRAAGAAIGVYANGWCALDQLQVGMELREKSILLNGIHDHSIYTSKPRITPFSNELRCLRRRDLVETLANNLPVGSIRFGCQIVGVATDSVTSFPVLSTSNGNTIKAKVLIGCDGAYSAVAKYLGLEAPKTFPMWITRGFTSYANGHKFENHFFRLWSKNAGFGRIPIDNNLVHIFIGHFLPPQDSAIKGDQELIKKFALASLQEFPAEVVEIAKNCDLESLSLTKVWYRAPWHLSFQKSQKGTITVAGDAMHVMGPFLGQGGSAGLEDAIVLARCLARAVPKGFESITNNHELFERVNNGLGAYVKERKPRIRRLCTQTYVVGSLISASSWIERMICSIILAIFFDGNSFSHTNYNCGTL